MYLFFLHKGLWNPEKFRIGTSGKIMDPLVCNSKYAFHIQKFIIQKNITDPPIRNRNIHSEFRNP